MARNRGPIQPTIRRLTGAGYVPVGALRHTLAGRGRGRRKSGSRRRSLGALVRGLAAVPGYPTGQHRRRKGRH